MVIAKCYAAINERLWVLFKSNITYTCIDRHTKTCHGLSLVGGINYSNYCSLHSNLKLKYILRQMVSIDLNKLSLKPVFAHFQG